MADILKLQGLGPDTPREEKNTILPIGRSNLSLFGCPLRSNTSILCPILRW